MLIYKLHISGLIGGIGITMPNTTLKSLNLFFTAFAIIITLLFNSVEVNGEGLFLQGYWKFDEGSGNIAYDETSNHNDGIISGSPTWTTNSYSGYALQFNDIDTMIPLGEPSSLADPLNKFAVEIWINVPSNNQYSSILFRDEAYDLYLENNYLKCKFFFDGAWSDRCGSFHIAGDLWYNITLIYDGSYINEYVNGNLISTSQENRQLFGKDSIYIGYRPYSDPYGNEYFLGNMDELRIYNDLRHPINLTIHSPIEDFVYNTSIVWVNITAVSNEENISIDTVWYDYLIQEPNITKSINYINPIQVQLKDIYPFSQYKCSPQPEESYRYLFVYANTTDGFKESKYAKFYYSIPDLIANETRHHELNNLSYGNAGEPVSFLIEIKNTCNAPSGGFDWIYDLDYDGNSTGIEKSYTDGFEPGDTIRLNLTYVYPLSGNYTFYFEVDPSNSVDEFDDSNNIELFTFFINGIPDLTPKFVSYQQDGLDKNKVAFDYDIKNIGTIYTENFVYNIDYGDGTGSGGYIFERINPREAYRLKLIHTYPSLGRYNVTIEIDPENKIPELNETNNVLIKEITLTKIPFFNPVKR